MFTVGSGTDGQGFADLYWGNMGALSSIGTGERRPAATLVLTVDE
jgi:hypothetical protein